jgi:hypothetical protein
MPPEVEPSRSRARAERWLSTRLHARGGRPSSKAGGRSERELALQASSRNTRGFDIAHLASLIVPPGLPI